MLFVAIAFWTIGYTLMYAGIKGGPGGAWARNPACLWVEAFQSLKGQAQNQAAMTSGLLNQPGGPTTADIQALINQLVGQGVIAPGTAAPGGIPNPAASPPAPPAPPTPAMPAAPRGPTLDPGAARSGGGFFSTILGALGL